MTTAMCPCRHYAVLVSRPQTKHSIALQPGTEKTATDELVGGRDLVPAISCYRTAVFLSLNVAAVDNEMYLEQARCLS